MGLVVLLPATAASGKRSKTRATVSCEATTTIPSRTTANLAERSILCLLNSERSQRGLRKLRSNGKLAKAARNHSRDMVNHGYFEHVRPGGPDLVQRIRSAGYLDGARSWSVGENIAWGTGEYATPAALVEAWMESPGHKRNILERNFREIGIGLAIGAPSGRSGSDFSASATTATTDFGRKG
jgi:uncharacterized protein YkwD